MESFITGSQQKLAFSYFVLAQMYHGVITGTLVEVLKLPEPIHGCIILTVIHDVFLATVLS